MWFLVTKNYSFAKTVGKNISISFADEDLTKKWCMCGGVLLSVKL